jgi:hypothetical protein
MLGRNQPCGEPPRHLIEGTRPQVRRPRSQRGVEMVVLPVSEILPVPGVDFLGTIPADLQFVQVFAAAMVKGATNPEASKRPSSFSRQKRQPPLSTRQA